MMTSDYNVFTNSIQESVYHGLYLIESAAKRIGGEAA
ncbi:MAG: hypothetical protein ETSY2_50150 [Candidatus Entotheonella gemina]|uniref:Uncharacterized protein n=1 Tax=Candidatus Entotheonella gemina TaxID=1429439 RepID=W4L854_9BACT|nr:MAG: hypothetical protein ETSY2_50150 [Candidatus Entotheonella gemina]